MSITSKTLEDVTQEWRKDMPAYIDADGTQMWHKDGKRHRDGDLRRRGARGAWRD